MAGGTQTPGDAGTAQMQTVPDFSVSGDAIELAVPALSSFVDIVRTATAGLAARLAFSFDDIEDLRIAVNEACTMVLALPGARTTADAALTCRYRVLPEALVVTVSVSVDPTAALPATQAIAWQVLRVHVSEVRGVIEDGQARVELRKPRGG
jgi:serine/threonine-protein kinase RsbW